jgi:hypothetical protein
VAATGQKTGRLTLLTLRQPSSLHVFFQM